MVRINNSFIFALAAFAACALYGEGALSQDAAAPRENLMKACGDKWRAVRDVEKEKGVTWPQFLSRCRSEAAAVRRDPAASTPTAAAAPAASASPAPQKALVFPDHVSPRHVGNRPGLARQRTCADQFKANKASGANGGLRWIQKGGGYWSLCNKHLKQTRA